MFKNHNGYVLCVFEIGVFLVKREHFRNFHCDFASIGCQVMSDRPSAETPIYGKIIGW